MADGRSRKGNRSTQTGSAADPHGHSDLTDPRAVSTSVTKAFRIVELLAAKPNGGLTLAELSLELGMPKSTTHRYLTTLVALGLTERDGADHFHVGTKLVELAGSFLANNDLRTESNAILDELAATTGETVHLAVPSGGEVVYIAKVESIHALRMYSHIGARLPMHSTSLGKAILAHLPVARVDEILRRADEGPDGSNDYFFPRAGRRARTYPAAGLRHRRRGKRGRGLLRRGGGLRLHGRAGRGREHLRADQPHEPRTLRHLGPDGARRRLARFPEDGIHAIALRNGWRPPRGSANEPDVLQEKR